MLLKAVFLFLIIKCFNCQSMYADLMKEATKSTSYDILKQEWESFKETHKKTYEDTEDLKRMQIFANNKLLIEKHNDLFKKDVVTFTLKMNEFGDMTDEEFDRYYKLKNIDSKYSSRREYNNMFIPQIKTGPPLEKDWRKEGAVTEVKNQGRCASCWAFSATGALEGNFYLRNKYLVSLSEQNLMDCSTKQYRNYGCVGGRPMYAFNYVRDNGGIDTENSYPYLSREGDQCRFNATYAIPTPDGFSDLGGSEATLLTVVGSYGPVSAIIDISDPKFKFYEKGVYYSTTCSNLKWKLNHAVLVVGYGVTDTAGEYWLVKNSWGKDFGEDGYIRMARNRNNNCGIATEAVFPV